MSGELQWLWFVLVGLAGMTSLAWIFRHRPALAGTVAVAALGTAAVAGWIRHQDLARRQVERNAFLATTPRQEHPGGYVTSDACRSCHPGPYATWHHSFHRTMTTLAGPDTVQAPFDGRPLELDGRVHRPVRRGDGFYVETRAAPGAGADPTIAASAPGTEQRLALVTGSHHLQIYWTAGGEGNLQRLFPFCWLIAEERWAPVRDTFLRDPAKGEAAQHWNLNCITCHATAGQPRQDARTGACDTRTGELGIACEACHGPGDRHAEAQRNPWRRYATRWAGGAGASIVNPARLDKRASAHACGQCHGIKWVPAAENHNVNGFSFRPGDDLDRSTPIVRPSRLDLQPFLREPLRRQPAFLDEHYWSDGEVRVSGREFNGLLDSPCYERGEMTCLSCHSMHRYQDRDDQLGPDRQTNEACLQCHGGIRDRLEAHTHHPGASSGSLCYNCHMPHTTYGLLKAIRSHRVSSPTIATSVATGRPNACNLCHLDRSLGWTAGHLQQWYGQPLPNLDPESTRRSAAVLWALAGDAGQRALIAWHMGWDPARQASGETWLAPYLAQLLEDPYAAVRFIAARSLRRLPGQAQLDFDFDFAGPPPGRAQARARALEAWREAAGPGPDRTGEAVLITPQGDLDHAEFERLLGRRNNQSMDLQE